MWKWTQRTFAGGQQDLTLAGRQDLATYFTSARTLENFIVKRQGCISKRRGTDIVANLDGLFGDGWKITHARAIPFVYERDGGYVLLFAEGAKKEYVTDEEGKEVSVTQKTRGAFVCSSMGLLLARKFVSRPGAVESFAPTDDTNTTKWSCTTFEEVDAGGPYLEHYLPKMIDIPYAGEDFNDIGYTQSGDTLFVAHEKYPFATIKHDGGGVFVYEAVDFLKQGGSTEYFAPLISTVKGGTEGGGTERTISYVATYVKDGIESAPSQPQYVKYTMPWMSSFAVDITVEKGANEEDPDYFNVYKRTSGDYGFIGSTRKVYEQVFPSVGTVSSTNATFGQYTLNRTGMKEVTKGSFSTASSAAFKKTFLDGGNRFAYSGSNMALRGGLLGKSSTNGLIIPFSGTPQFTDVEILFGISSYMSSDDDGYGYVAGDFFHWGTFLYFTPLEADGVEIEMSIKHGSAVDKLNSGDIDINGSAKEEFVMLTYFSTKKGNTYSSSVAKVGDVSRVYNQQPAKYSFAEQIEDLQWFAEPGVTWSVSQIVIKAFKRVIQADGTYEKEYVAPSVSYIDCFFQHGGSTFMCDDNITPDTSLTPPKNDPHFNEHGDYPSCVSLYNQRLALAATDKQPFTLWMSTVGDLYNFNTHDSIRDDDAIEATIPATEFPEVNHIVSARELLVLCDNGEWVVKPSSGNALTYRTMEIKQQSQIGCSKRLPPLSVGDEAIFAENTSETLRAIKYSWESDGFVSTDLSVLSQSLTRGNPIIDYAYKQHPDSTIVCVLQDGTIATLTYMKEHEVCAWSTATLGGGLKAVGICTDKAIRGGTTDLYILAADERGGHSLLRVREDSPAATVEESLCLDAMRTVEVAADATEVPSIPSGMVAYDLADGRKVEVLEKGYAYAMGYPYEAIFRSVTPEAQGQNTIQFELKGAKSAELRLENASAFKIVPSALEDESDVNYWTTCGDDVKVVDGKVTYSAQDHFVELAGDANTSGAITIKSDSPWPMSLLSYSINFEFDPRLLGQNG